MSFQRASSRLKKDKLNHSNVDHHHHDISNRYFSSSSSYSKSSFSRNIIRHLDEDHGMNQSTSHEQKLNDIEIQMSSLESTCTSTITKDIPNHLYNTYTITNDNDISFFSSPAIDFFTNPNQKTTPNTSTSASTSTAAVNAAKKRGRYQLRSSRKNDHQTVNKATRTSDTTVSDTTSITVSSFLDSINKKDNHGTYKRYSYRKYPKEQDNGDDADDDEAKHKSFFLEDFSKDANKTKTCNGNNKPFIKSKYKIQSFEFSDDGDDTPINNTTSNSNNNNFNRKVKNHDDDIDDDFFDTKSKRVSIGTLKKTVNSLIESSYRDKYSDSDNTFRKEGKEKTKKKQPSRKTSKKSTEKLYHDDTQKHSPSKKLKSKPMESQFEFNEFEFHSQSKEKRIFAKKKSSDLKTKKVEEFLDDDPNTFNRDDECDSELGNDTSLINQRRVKRTIRSFYEPSTGSSTKIKKTSASRNKTKESSKKENNHNSSTSRSGENQSLLNQSPFQRRHIPLDEIDEEDHDILSVNLDTFLSQTSATQPPTPSNQLPNTRNSKYKSSSSNTPITTGINNDNKSSFTFNYNSPLPETSDNFLTSNSSSPDPVSLASTTKNSLKNKCPKKQSKLDKQISDQSSSSKEESSKDIKPIKRKPKTQMATCPQCQQSIEMNKRSKPILEKTWTSFIKSVTSHPDRDNERHFSFAFCRLHKSLDDIVPEGISKGYPKTVDFVKLKKRIWKLIPRVFQECVDNQSGHFMEMAKYRYTTLGIRRAQATNHLKLDHIKETQCGYYGYKTNSMIGKLIIKHPLAKQLQEHPVQQFRYTEFIQDILVPEIGCRLIQQDRHCNIEEAIFVMRESREFGNTLFGESSSEEDG